MCACLTNETIRIKLMAFIYIFRHTIHK